MRAFLTTHLPTASWAVLTAVGLLWPDPSPEGMDSLPDWTSTAAHFILFLVMVLLLGRSLKVAHRPRPLVTAFVLSFAYGLALEAAQVSIEGRAAEWQDVVMNGLGGLAGAAAAGLLERRRQEPGLTRSSPVR